MSRAMSLFFAALSPEEQAAYRTSWAWCQHAIECQGSKNLGPQFAAARLRFREAMLAGKSPLECERLAR